MTSPTSPVPEMGRLQSTFTNTPLSTHPSKWDSLWKESYTPWDRGGPSLALGDLITSRRDFFPSGSTYEGRKPKALVPGCGRGYDAVLLAVLGYDVVGLDYSAAAVEQARVREGSIRDEEGWGVWEGKGGRDRGRVTWVQGDFFDDEWVREVGKGGFDVIFDYTFFCALPPEARPRWAKRMSELLATNGRLVCLEWPLHKDPSTGGPPWGLTAEVYLAHLAHPGEDIRYGEDGKLVPEEVDRPATETGLKRLPRLQPDRTHKAGYDGEGNLIDYISVWSH